MSVMGVFSFAKKLFIFKLFAVTVSNIILILSEVWSRAILSDRVKKP